MPIGFDFNTRHPRISQSVIDSIKNEVRALCPSTPKCTELYRGSSCGCYSEFAARYWLRLGSFPVIYTDKLNLNIRLADPTQADAIDKFLSSPSSAVRSGWSSLISGPIGSGKTTLATILSKCIMKWKMIHDYTPNTRAIYFSSRDYLTWLKKMDSYNRTESEVGYYEGALCGTIMVWDDIDVAFANDVKFVHDLKKRISNRGITHIILSGDLAMYSGSLLFNTLGVHISNNYAHIGVPNFMSLQLTGTVMSEGGWT